MKAMKMLLPAAAALSLAGHVWAVRTVRADRVRLAEARRQVTIDPLTGLANRSGLSAVLADLVDEPYDVALVDLDGFKQVNDTFGHDAGDAVLVEVAARLSAALDEVDGAVVARLGGDEIVLVCPSPAPIAGILGAEVVRALAAPVVLPGGRELLVRASVGAVSAMAGDDSSRVLRAADLALYRAKAAGGGQVAEYDRAEDLPVIEQRPVVRLREMTGPARVLGGAA
ncbi:GGDEF domain-containing protein [Micromonospora sp. RL09-050-HVF-A]|uniref:GGDEF domain-containing protein n=1 Tax=Micromonospora sp. RL09-050-HVF-A TaxID=1703433 RepID=UPI001C5D70E6|nr:GGDEF domain-containing protein [Micromonospora sp. RL09-050-HVF-A]MBW4700339.1 GGDEF domain-containing protein [Micromonospora sp. RL09-050-HVF-A]